MESLKKGYSALVLSAYIAFFSYLLSTGSIREYVNPRLSFFSIMVLSILIFMLLSGLTEMGRRTHGHNCGHVAGCCHDEGFEAGNLLLLLPPLLALLVPPYVLSYQSDILILRDALPQLTTIFLSIVIQALPFVLVGVFGSSIMQRIVTVEMVENALSRINRLPGILLAIGAGFFFPVCDCGVIPVVRRLLVKRVPPYMAIAFLVTAPLVNPITIWATATAFGYSLPVTLIRVGMAILVGIAVAFAASILFPSAERLFRREPIGEPAADHSCGSTGHRAHEGSAIADIFEHANDEFLEVGKYLIIGALIAAGVQTMVPKQALMAVTGNSALSVLAMMLLAFCLSLCAEADAFVARSFMYHFPLGSVMAFMVFGQMIDIKNGALLLKSFKLKAVIFVFGLCGILVFLLCGLLNLVYTGNVAKARFLL